MFFKRKTPGKKHTLNLKFLFYFFFYFFYIIVIQSSYIIAKIVHLPAKDDIFSREMNDLCNNITGLYDNYIIIGDLNFNLLTKTFVMTNLA